MTGNYWGLHTGRLETVEPALLGYLNGLEEKGYPFERVAVQYSGVFIDNAPPATVPCDLIRRWNERYVWPRLRSSTASEFLRWVEAEHGANLPVHRQAWPDWWSDGIGSAPREAAAVRVAQGRLTAVEGVLAIDRLLGTPLPDGLLERIAAARDRLVLYGEHTYGAAESVRDPAGQSSMVQWAQKAAYAWDAVKETALLEEAALGLLQGYLDRADVPTISVVNTLARARSGLVRVYIDHALLPPGAPFHVVDEGGEEAPTQEMSRLPDGTWWGLWVSDVPPLGFRTYRLELQAGSAGTDDEPVADPLVLENQFYRVRVDPQRGAVTSLYDKQLGVELVDPSAPWLLGQLVHETLSNRDQLERFTLTGCERRGFEILGVEPGDRGPIWQSLVVRGRASICPGDDGMRLEIRLFEQSNRVELHYRVRKRPSIEPESLYAAFPVGLTGAIVTYETCGGAADPTRDLLPGTSSDWQAVQGYVSVVNERARVLLSSREALLVQLGGLNLGRFEPVARIERPHVYAWLLNNYWVTNFKASEEGELTWSVVLSSTAATDDPVSAARFGLKESVPLLARVLPALPAADRSKPRGPVSTLSLSHPGVILVGARPERGGNGVILHLREVAGRSSPAHARNLPLRRVSPLEDALGGNTAGMELAPYESAFVRVEPRRLP
jgi:hypothetical protein